MKKNKKTLANNEKIKLYTESDWGWGKADVGSLYSTFIQPFTDVAQTAVAAGLEVGNQAYGLFKTMLGGVLASIIPFVDVEYEEIHRETQARTDSIKSKFKDVFDRTDNVLKDSHFKTLLFLVNPGAAIVSSSEKIAARAKKAIEKAPGVAADSIKATWDTAKKAHQQSVDALAGKFLSENQRLNEDTDSEKFIKNINDSKLANEMKKEAVEIIKTRLKGYFNTVDKIDNAKSVDELQKILKFNKKVLTQHDGIKSQEDKEEIEIQVIDDATEQVKNSILGALENEKKSFSDAGFDVSEIIKLYDQAINTIKSI